MKSIAEEASSKGYLRRAPLFVARSKIGALFCGRSPISQIWYTGLVRTMGRAGGVPLP